MALLHVLILQYTESRSNCTSVLEADLSLVAQWGKHGLKFFIMAGEGAETIFPVLCLDWLSCRYICIYFLFSITLLCFCDSYCYSILSICMLLDAFLIEFFFLYLIITHLSNTYYILGIVLKIMHLSPLILIKY